MYMTVYCMLVAFLADILKGFGFVNMESEDLFVVSGDHVTLECRAQLLTYEEQPRIFVGGSELRNTSGVVVEHYK